MSRLTDFFLKQILSCTKKLGLWSRTIVQLISYNVIYFTEKNLAILLYRSSQIGLCLNYLCGQMWIILLSFICVLLFIDINKKFYFFLLAIFCYYSRGSCNIKLVTFFFSYELREHISFLLHLFGSALKWENRIWQEVVKCGHISLLLSSCLLHTHCNTGPTLSDPKLSIKSENVHMWTG